MLENKSFLPAGTKLHDRYRIDEGLGKGGFGITYKGEDVLLNIPVAIKEYFPAGQVSRDITQTLELQWTQGRKAHGMDESDDFLKEARKMAKLHEIPGIVKVRDTFYENQTSYIVMDYVEGVTLNHWLKQNGTMAYDECLKLMAPLIKSMGEVHRQGLIHRDISPDNIVLKKDGTLCLLDLGAAKDMTAMLDRSPSQLVAKKGFSPAEQYTDNGSTGPWTDVYAFCATIYFCVYGRLIPDALSRMERDTLSFPLVNDKKLPQAFVNMLWEGLAVKPEVRTQDMNMLYDSIAPMIREKKKISPKTIGAAAAALAVVLVAAGLSVTKPWIKTVAELGSRNGNILGNGWLNMREADYECYVDHMYNLYFLDYDAEERAFVKGDQPMVENSRDALFINTTDDYVYFEKYNYDTDLNQMIAMDTETRQMQVLFEQKDYMKMIQYAKLSDGREYLYYIVEENDASYLYRYDLAKGNVEKVSESIVFWYNLYKDALYYTTVDKTSTILCTSRVDGSSPKTLNDAHNYSYGFVEDDMIFLTSITDKQVEVLDLKGNVLYNLSGQNIDTEHLAFAYEDSWIYYADHEEKSIRKCFYDGSRDQLVYDGIYAVHLCIQEGQLWIGEGKPDDGMVTKAYMMGTLQASEPVPIGE